MTPRQSLGVLVRALGIYIVFTTLQQFLSVMTTNLTFKMFFFRFLGSFAIGAFLFFKASIFEELAFPNSGQPRVDEGHGPDSKVES
tara:strand:+ start:2073 stop:2330 length:258 start_codon:yes stop_codon:yes gene_type:complete